MSVFFFFFNDPATTEISTLSLHDALPIYVRQGVEVAGPRAVSHRLQAERRHRPPLPRQRADDGRPGRREDRKSTRLNSSHGYISYAVFCLKKKKQQSTAPTTRKHAPPPPR